jgi:hypothetical protein
MEKQEYKKNVAEYADVQLMMSYREKVGMERGERRSLVKSNSSSYRSEIFFIQPAMYKYSQSKN